MKCKNCGAQVDENERYCSSCGEEITPPDKDNANELPQPEATRYDGQAEFASKPAQRSKLPVIIGSAVLVVAIVVVLIVSGVFSSDPTELGDEPQMSDTTAPTTSVEGSDTTIPLELGPERGGDEIAAQMMDHSLDNSTLGFYYWEEGNNLINSYGGYGLFDTTVAFSLQEYPYEEYATWHDMIVEMAVDRWATYTIMYDIAVAAGHQMDEVYSDYLASVPDYLKADAEAQGLEPEAFLAMQYGKFADMDGFLAYMEKYCLVSSFINEQYEAIY